MWPRLGRILPALALTLVASAPAVAASTTYSYTGPGFTSNGDRVSISFTTAAPLAPNTSYLSQAAAGVTASGVTVVRGSGAAVPNMGLPVQTFQVHTNAAGLIDAWFIFGGFNTLAGNAPTMTGIDRQAYSMNTLVFIPGSEVAGATGLVTGRYSHDQATETQFYAGCAGAPAGCTLAGNGQPYVTNYAGMISPSNTSGAWWTVSTGGGNPPPPPPVSVTISGTLPGGTVGQAYSAGLSVSGGSAPYTWSATNLPPGLVLNGGTVAGVPTAAGTYAAAIRATDAAGNVGSYATSINIVNAGCSGSNATITSVGRDFLVVNGGLNLGDHVWYTPTPMGTTFTGGTTGFVTGELIDWSGWMDPASGCHATSMTVKPAATLSCTRPAGARTSSGKSVVTAVGPGYIVAAGKRIDHAACTVKRYGGYATAPAVGDRVEWEGYVQTNGNVMATRLTFN